MNEQLDFLTARRGVCPGGIRGPVKQCCTAQTDSTGQDVCANRHGGNVNSRAANRVTDKAKAIADILRFLNTVDDATCDEVEVALDMKHQTCSARFSDLKRAGAIRPTVRRPTRSGCTAQAWAVI